MSPRKVWTEEDRKVHRTASLVGLLKERLLEYQELHNYTSPLAQKSIDQMTPNVIKFRNELTKLEPIAVLERMYRLKTKGNG